MRDIWRRIEAEIGGRAPDELEKLGPGATEAQIAHLEAIIGRRLPDDLRESFAIHDGTRDGLVPSGQDLDGFDALLSVEAVARELGVWRDLLKGGEFRDSKPVDLVGPIKPAWWDMGWVPIVGEGTGDHLCIDLDPAEGGTVGQVFDFGHETGPTRVLFPSFRAYLERYADDLEAYAIEFDEGGEWVRTETPDD